MHMTSYAGNTISGQKGSISVTDQLVNTNTWFKY